MKPILIINCFLLSAISVLSQHTSEDFKDAAGCGPFPIYIGAGWVTSQFHDFNTVGRSFNDFYDPGKKAGKALHGIHANIGAPIIGKDNYKKKRFPFSFGLEAKHILLMAETSAAGNSFRMISNQFSAGLGMRFAAFPFMLQAQYQQIITSRQNYLFKIDNERRQVDVASGGSMILGRISFLDPAGSDGGFGVFVEYGLVRLLKPKDNALLTEAIQMFNNAFDGTENCARGYQYFTVGITVPLALRIK